MAPIGRRPTGFYCFLSGVPLLECGRRGKAETVASGKKHQEGKFCSSSASDYLITKCSLHPEISRKQVFTLIISTYYPECYLSIWSCVCICGANLNHWLTNRSILRYGGTGKNLLKSLFKNKTKRRRVAYTQGWWTKGDGAITKKRTGGNFRHSAGQTSTWKRKNGSHKREAKKQRDGALLIKHCWKVHI